MGRRGSEQRASAGRMSGVDGALLALGVSCAAALPWLVDRWPAEEEPRRLAVAHALIALDRPGSPYDGLIDPAAVAHPVYTLLAGGGRWIGVAAAGRLACSLAIAGLLLTQWLLLRRLAPQRWTGIHLLVPLATGPLLLRGGTPLLIGLALGLAAVALVAPPLAREHDRVPTAAQMPAAAGAAALLAAAGAIAPLAALLCLAALLLLVGRTPWTRRGWPLAALLAVAALPALGRGAAEWLAAPDAPPWVHARLDDRVLAMLGADLATFSSWEAVVRRPLVLCLLAGAALAARRGGVRGPVGRLLAGSTAISLLMPSVAGLAPCSEMAADALLWTACAAAFSLPGRLRPAAIGAAGVALAACLTAVQARAMVPAVAAIEQVVAVGRQAPAGSRVLPLRFGAPAGAIDPLRHAWAHAAIERDLVTPFLTGGGPLLSCASPLPIARTRLPHLGEDAAAHIEAIHAHGCAGVSEPAIDCGCAAWQATRYAALLAAARAYDRLLIVEPPESLLAAARGQLIPLARAGGVHLFAVQGPDVPDLPDDVEPDAGLLCEP